MADGNTPAFDPSQPFETVSAPKPEKPEKPEKAAAAPTFDAAKPFDVVGAAPKEPKDEGYFGAATRGVSNALKGFSQTAEVATGKKPAEEEREPTLAEQPMEWNDFRHPTTAAKKAILGLAESSPAMVAFGAGAAATTPFAGPVAGLGAGAMAAAVTTGAQSLGPKFAHELKLTPQDPDGAYNRAVASTALESGIAGVGFAAFGWAPFRSGVKNLLFQAMGVQPGVSVAGKAATNVAEGKPVGEDVTSGVPGAIIGTAAPAIAHAAGAAGARAIGRALRPGESAAPATGEEPVPATETPPRTEMPPITALEEIERLTGEPLTAASPEEAENLAARKNLEAEVRPEPEPAEAQPAATEPRPAPAPAAEEPRAAAPPAPAEPAAAEPVTVPRYVDDYQSGAGRDSPEHQQFAATNAAAIEQEFARRAADEIRTEKPALAVEPEAVVSAHPRDGTSERPILVRGPEDLAVARRHIEMEPTEAQKTSGNYPKGHIVWAAAANGRGGIDGALETGKGSVRTGVDADGKEWSAPVPHDYGYFKKTKGADGDEIDAFFGPNPKAEHAFVIDQNHLTDGVYSSGPKKGQPYKAGDFDEHKVMAGFDTEAEAVGAYKEAFSDGRGAARIRGVTPMPMALFKRWLKVGDTTGPLGDQTVKMSGIIDDIAAGRVGANTDDIATRYNIKRDDASRLLEEISRRPDTPIELASRTVGNPENEKHRQTTEDVTKMRWRLMDADTRQARIRDHEEWAAQHYGLDHNQFATDGEFFDALQERIRAEERAHLQPIIDHAKTMGLDDLSDAEARDAIEMMADGTKIEDAVEQAYERGAFRMEHDAAEEARNTEGVPDEWKSEAVADPALARPAEPAPDRPGPEPTQVERPDQIRTGEAGEGPAGPPAEAPRPEPVADEPQRDLHTGAAAFADAFRQGRRFESIVQARKFAAEHAGVDMAAPGAKKLLDETIERGAALRARQIVDGHRLREEPPQNTFDALVDLYSRQPILAERTADSKLLQAYSTPAPIAYLASELAGIDRSKTVYEPTAGNGMLLLDADPKLVIANEIDPARAAFLKEIGVGFLTSNDALQHRAPALADVVIANPPFGKVTDEAGNFRRFKTPKYVTTEIDHAIVFQALQDMKPDGSAVLIVAGKKPLGRERTEQAVKDLYNTQSSRAFYKALYDDYNVTDHFTIAGELYDRQGAAWPIDIIQITGRGKSDRPLPGVEVPRTYDSFEELKGLLSGERSVGAPGEHPGADLGIGSAGGTTEPTGLSGTADVAGPRAVEGGGEGPSGVGSREPDPEHRVPGSAAEPVGGAAGAGERAGTDETRGGYPGAPVAAEGGRSEPAGGEGAGASRPADLAAASHTERLKHADIAAAFDGALEAAFKDHKPQEAARSGDRSLGDVARDLGSMFQVPRLNVEVPPREATAARKDLDPGVDAEKYSRVQPLLAEGIALMGVHKGETPQSMVQRLVTALRDVYGFSREKIAAMKNYVLQFVKDTHAGVVKFAEGISRRKENAEAETQYQVRYSPSSEAEAVGTLVPVNMQTAITRSLEALRQRVGNIDDFVAKELGYSRDEVVGTKEKPGYFSAEQVDALAMAIDNLDRGAGFIIGDQTGVGKGRFVAGMMRYAMNKGQAPIFVTANPALYADMFRDVRDIGMPKFQALVTNSNLTGENRIPLGNNESLESLPKSKLDRAFAEIRESGKLPKGFDALFTNYSQMQFGSGGKAYDRHHVMTALAPNSLMVLDESHQAGGTASKRIDPETGKELPGRADFARTLLGMANGAVYSSATYAKNPHVMSLYFKTDMPLAVPKIEDLAPLIESGGVPLQQVVANMLVEAGQYARRERSYDGVEMNMKSAPVNIEHAEKVSSLLRSVFDLDKQMAGLREAYGEKLAGAGEGLGSDNAVGETGVTSVNFSSIMHNVIGQSLMALKAKSTVEDAVAAWKRGEKTVIALSNTFGALLDRYVDEHGLKPKADLSGLNFNRVFENYLRRTREVTVKDPFDPKKKNRVTISDDDMRDLGFGFLADQYKAVENEIRTADISSMPGSPLDYIRDQMQAAGMKVGEITGRKLVIDNGALAQRDDSAAAKKRQMNDFNSGKLDTLIINSAGSTGFSLHASVNYHDLNEMMEKIPARQRHMILLQADPNIDTFMQILGRVHRTGQIVVPKYTLLASDLPAEKRPAAVLMRKMASLNANTSANRESSVSLKSAVDFMNKYGDEVVGELLHDDPALAEMLGVRPSEEGTFMPGIAQKATGRLAILPIARQEEIYTRLEKSYGDLLDTLNRLGRNTLEAKTLDIEAKTIKTEGLTEDKGLDSPFAKPAYLEQISAKRLGKPYTLDEVKDRIRAVQGMATDAPLTPRVIQETVAKFNNETKMAVGVYRRELDGGLALLRGGADELKARFDATKDEKVGKLLDKALDRVRVMWSRVEGAEKAVAVIEQMSEAMRPGEAVTVTAGSGQGAEEYMAYSLGLTRDKATKNPLGLSSYTAHFAVADGSQEVKVPLSKIASKSFTVTPALREVVKEAFESGQAAGRENRNMITGNLLAGYAKFGGHGMITMFRDADGNTRQGILLPRTFDPQKYLEKQSVELTTDQAMKFMDDLRAKNAAAFVKSEDGLLSVQRPNASEYVFKAAAKGGNAYFLNKTVNKTVNEMLRNSLMLGSGQFTQRRGDKAWTATTDRETAQKIMQHYAENLGVSYHAEHEKGLARSIVQETTPPKTGAKPAFSAGEAAAPVPEGSHRYRLPDGTTAEIRPRAEFVEKERDIASRVDAIAEKMFPGAKALAIDHLTGDVPGRGPTELYGSYQAVPDGTGLMHVLAWSLESPHPEQTMRHEGLHFLKRAGYITAPEWKTLVDHAEKMKWADAYDIDRRYPGLDARDKAEEAVADGFADWRRARFGGLPEPIRKMFHKIDLFLRRTAAAVRSIMGRDATAADILTKIETGEIGRRTPGTEEGTRRGAAETPKAAEQPLLSTPEPRPGFTRLYRADAKPGGNKAPDWAIEGKRESGQAEAEGRWFTQDKDALDWYRRDAGDGSLTHYVDVPTADLDKFRVSNNTERFGTGRPVKSYSRDPENEFFLPRATADSKKMLVDRGVTADEVAARKRAQQKEEAEIRMLGRDRARVEQKDADELPLFGGDRQKSMFEVPKVDEPSPEEIRGPLGPKPGTLRAHLQAAADQIMDLKRSTQMALSPMSVGPDFAKAAAVDFANLWRLARTEGNKLLDWMKPGNKKGGDLSDADLKTMYLAAEEQNLAMENGEDTKGIGIDRLSPKLRGIVDQINATSQANLRAARRLGMFRGDGKPFYSTHAAVELVDGLARKLGDKGPGMTALDPVGRNLTTSTPQLKYRKYKSLEEFEAAIKEAFGPNAEAVKDIRATVAANMKLQEAIAGKALIRAIKRTGAGTGENYVAEGGRPADGRKWFTIDHPSFRQVRTEIDPQTGKPRPMRDAQGNTVYEPIFVRSEWEGPLRAVLSRDTNKVYRAMMDLKSRQMSLIMYSPLIHNMVEWGRAMPAAPGKLLTLGAYRDGAKALADRGTMREMLLHRMDPIGKRFSFQDITSIANENADFSHGRSYTAKVLAAVPGMFSKDAGTAVKKAVDKMGDVWHNKLLWDQVAKLQAGLYVNFRDDMVAKGADPESAKWIAAHFANRFAGALPREAMSTGARMFANLMLFSRTFTLGNLGIMKDALTGLPSEIQAKISQQAGDIAKTTARSLAMRKAAMTVMADIALFHIGNAVMQSAIAMMSGNSDLNKEEAGYLRRLQALYDRGKENWTDLLNPISDVTALTPQGENEPNKQNRVRVGTQADGTAVYMYSPIGKVGEELEDWLPIGRPLDTIRRKLAPWVRPAVQTVMNREDFGRQIYDPYAETPSGWMENLGAVVSHFLGNQIPMQAIDATRDFFAGRGDPTLNAARVLSPLVAGVTFSRGYPGGPAEAERAKVDKQYEFRTQQALPAIRKQIQDGNLEAAEDHMTKLGMSPKDQKRIIDQVAAPRQELTGSQKRRFEQRATPEERRRLAALQESQN